MFLEPQWTALLTKRVLWAGTGLHTALLVCTVLAVASGKCPAAEGLRPKQVPASQKESAEATLSGTVIDTAGTPVQGAQITLQAQPATTSIAATTDTQGNFTFPKLGSGRYGVQAVKGAQVSPWTNVAVKQGSMQRVQIILPVARSASRSAPGDSMSFSDAPNFTIAGVTDWTAVGGHGSDATLQASEDLNRTTRALPGDQPDAAQGSPSRQGDVGEDEARLRAAWARAPQSYGANHELGVFYLHSGRFGDALPVLEKASALSGHAAEDEYTLALACKAVGDAPQASQHIQRALAQRDVAKDHRLAGDVDEALGDALQAVQQMQRATHLDPSEANYFAWGSELLVHRAIWQAVEVFAKGADTHRASTRLRTGWGAALFAGGLSAEAAAKLCEASEIDPAAPEPYLFMGKIALASAQPLACVQDKLKHFVQAQPDRAEANFYYGMLLWREDRPADQERVEAFLRKATMLNPRFSEAYLQLGILAFDQHRYADAIAPLKQAIATDPGQVEAHYRLAMAYGRMGDATKAREELQLHAEMEQREADTVEQQRREVKQFVVALPKGPLPSQPAPN